MIDGFSLWAWFFLNECAQDFIDKKQEDAIGRKVWYVFSRFINSDFQKQLEDAMSTGSFTSFEYYGDQQKNGFISGCILQIKFFLFNSNNITDEKIAHLLGRKAMSGMKHLFRQMPKECGVLN